MCARFLTKSTWFFGGHFFNVTIFYGRAIYHTDTTKRYQDDSLMDYSPLDDFPRRRFLRGVTRKMHQPSLSFPDCTPAIGWLNIPAHQHIGADTLSKCTLCLYFDSCARVEYCTVCSNVVTARHHALESGKDDFFSTR